MPLKIEDCEVGMQVKLTHPMANYFICCYNPAVDSQWECKGTITKSPTYPNTKVVTVIWENGESNVYNPTTLSSIEEGNYISIWGDF